MMEQQKKSNRLAPLVLGGVVGSASALLVWIILSRVLDSQFERGKAELVAQLSSGRTDLTTQLSQARRELGTMVRAELDRQVPPTVRQELQNTLSSYGLTPEIASKIRSLVNYVSRSGWI